MDTKAGRHGIKFLQLTLHPPVWRDLKVLVSGLAPPIGNHFGAIHLPLCTSTGARGRDEEWGSIALFKWISSGKGGCSLSRRYVHTQYTQYCVHTILSIFQRGTARANNHHTHSLSLSYTLTHQHTLCRHTASRQSDTSIDNSQRKPYICLL